MIDYTGLFIRNTLVWHEVRVDHVCSAKKPQSVRCKRGEGFSQAFRRFRERMTVWSDARFMVSCTLRYDEPGSEVQRNYFRAYHNITVLELMQACKEHDEAKAKL